MQEITKIIRRYLFLAFAFQIIEFRKWSNRMQWKRAVRSGIKIGSLCLLVVICWWTVAVGKLNLLNWPLPFFIWVVLLNLIGIPLFKMSGIFSIPDRAPLLNQTALPYSIQTPLSITGRWRTQRRASLCLVIAVRKAEGIGG